MPFKFNPFSGNFDLTGSGGGATVFDGEVQFFSDLPQTVGTPPVNSSYFVRESEGTVWFGNKKQKGIYIRSGNSGVRNDDWTYGGEYPVTSVNGQTGAVTVAAATHAVEHEFDGADPLQAKAALVETDYAPLNGVYFWDGTTTSGRPNFFKTGTRKNTKIVYNSGTNQWNLVRNLTVEAVGVDGPNTVPWGNTWEDFVTPTTVSVTRLPLETMVQKLAETGSAATATTSDDGLMSSSDKTKLNGIAAGAEVNVNSDWNASSGDAQILNKPSTFAPSAHAASHASAGGDVLALDASQITSGTFDNARINFAAPPAIGSTTRNTGAFTTLSANNGTITASAPVLDLEQTWNNINVAFTGMRLNWVQTANNVSSSYFTISRTGTPIFQIVAQTPNIPLIEIGTGGFLTRIRGRLSSGVGLNFDGAVGVGGSLQFGVGATTGGGDVILARDSAANTLAQVNGTNAQTFRLYNTSANSNADFERGFMRWSSNVLQIGTEAGGTGTARNLEFTVAPRAAGYNSNTTWLTMADSTSGPRFALYSHGGVLLRDSGYWGWNSSGTLVSGSTGDLRMYRSGAGILLLQSDTSTFDRIQFGGTTSSFPALKRSSTALQVRLADDSADAPLSCSVLTVSSDGASGSNNGAIRIGTEGVGFYRRATNSLTFSAGNAEFGPSTFSVSSSITFGIGGNAAQSIVREAANDTGIRNAGNAQSFRIFNTFTSTTSFERANFRWASNEFIIDAEAGSGGGTLRGIKIGSATSSLLGFYGATPVTQRAAIADATDAATTQARLNDLLAAMRSLGLIAT